jgi:hypothetical protein
MARDIITLTTYVCFAFFDQSNFEENDQGLGFEYSMQALQQQQLGQYQQQLGQYQQQLGYQQQFDPYNYRIFLISFFDP